MRRWLTLLCLISLSVSGFAQDAAYTDVVEIKNFYEVVSVWIPPLVDPVRADTTYLFTVTTDLLTNVTDTTFPGGN